MRSLIFIFLASSFSLMAEDKEIDEWLKNVSLCEETMEKAQGELVLFKDPGHKERVKIYIDLIRICTFAPGKYNIRELGTHLRMVDKITEKEFKETIERVIVPLEKFYPELQAYLRKITI